MNERRNRQNVPLLLERVEQHPEDRKQEQQAQHHSGGDAQPVREVPTEAGVLEESQNRFSRRLLSPRNTNVSAIVMISTITAIAADSGNFSDWKACW